MPLTVESNVAWPASVNVSVPVPTAAGVPAANELAPYDDPVVLYSVPVNVLPGPPSAVITSHHALPAVS